MTKKEFEEKMVQFNIKKISNKGLIKSIIERNREYYTKKDEVNIIYGIQKKDKLFVIFFKDTERGITTELGNYSKEEEAYENLLNKINTWELEGMKK